MSVAIARSGRTVRFLGKKEVFDAPVVGQLATAMGGIRVDRGTGSDEPLQAAADALAGGEVVAIMPQGTIPRGPAFFDPELKGRWGAARLAAADEGAGDPDRAVGHREGVAAVEPAAQRAQRRPTRRRSASGSARRSSSSTARSTPTRSGSWRRSPTLLPAEARQAPHADAPRSWPPPTRPGYQGDPDGRVDRRPGTD